MPVPASCPRCRHVFTISNSMAGRPVDCPSCSATFNAPALVPATIRKRDGVIAPIAAGLLIGSVVVLLGLWWLDRLPKFSLADLPGVDVKEMAQGPLAVLATILLLIPALAAFALVFLPLLLPMSLALCGILGMVRWLCLAAFFLLVATAAAFMMLMVVITGGRQAEEILELLAYIFWPAGLTCGGCLLAAAFSRPPLTR